MMRQFLLLTAVLFTSYISRAQTTPPPWAWAKADTSARTAGTPANALAATHGKVLWAEMQNKRMNYGSYILGDHGLMEYDSSGKFLDSTTITGKFHLLDAQADNSGNWYVLGAYYDTVNFPTGVRFVRDPSVFPALSEYFVFRLNSGTLSMAWLQHIGTNNYNTASAFAIVNNSLYIVVDSVTTYICKMDLSTGSRTVLWPQTGMSRVSSIAADNAGNIYVAGSCAHDSMAFNGHIETVPYFYNSYIVRYKASGAFDWIHWMDDISCLPRTISLVTNNFIYYSGQLYDSMQIGSYKLHKPPFLGNGFMCARLDSSGNVLWARQEMDTIGGRNSINDSYIASATSDSCLQLFLRTSGSVNFGNGFISPMPFFKNNATILCIKPDSTTKWVKYIAGINTNTGHIISNGKDIYVTGSGYDSTALQFDSVAAPVRIGAFTPYLAKIGEKPLPDTSTNVPVIPSLSFTISPNPATSNVYVSGLEKLNGGPISVSLTDISGRVVLQKTYQKATARETINVANYARGLYFIEVKTAAYKEIQKLVLE